MSRQTIKAFVEKRVLEGADADTIWREARKEFPHRCVGWGYICTLRKDIIDGQIAKVRIEEIYRNP